MKLIELTQGTPEWHAHRQSHFNASDAPAMLGVSPYKTREQLLRETITGQKPQISAYLQAIFDRGHKIEALARDYAEQIIGEDLFPCVGVLENTKLSASFDGLTMDGKTVFECKTLNNGLREIKGELPLHYRVQLEQQLLVSGAETALFIAAQLDESGALGERIEEVYYSDDALRRRIINGWLQFEKDLADYEAKEVDAPLIGQAPDAQNALPLLQLTASGQLTASNLGVFKVRALAALSQINTELKTDQDFADAETSAKWCKQVEDALAEAKDELLIGAGIAQALNELDAIKSRFAGSRKALTKAVKAEKSKRIDYIVFSAYGRILKCAAELGLPDNWERPVYLPHSLNALGSATKNLKTLSSVQNAVDAVELKYKSAANEAARQAKQKKEVEALANESCAQEQAEGINLDQINRAIAPLQLLSADSIRGLLAAMAASDWQAIKTALIEHIEQAISTQGATA